MIELTARGRRPNIRNDWFLSAQPRGVKCFTKLYIWSPNSRKSGRASHSRCLSKLSSFSAHGRLDKSSRKPVASVYPVSIFISSTTGKVWNQNCSSTWGYTFLEIACLRLFYLSYFLENKPLNHERLVWSTALQPIVKTFAIVCKHV